MVEQDAGAGRRWKPPEGEDLGGEMNAPAPGPEKNPNGIGSPAQDEAESLDEQGRVVFRAARDT